MLFVDGLPPMIFQAFKHLVEIVVDIIFGDLQDIFKGLLQLSGVIALFLVFYNLNDSPHGLVG